MPSPVGHSIINFSVYLFFKRKLKLKSADALLIIFIGLLSDIDIAIVFITKNVYLHRTITHSFTFAILVFLSLYFLLKNKKLGVVLFFILILHLIMDYFTVDILPPAGIMLFWPFNGNYYQSPFCIFDGFDWRTTTGIFSKSMAIAILKEISITIPVLLGALYVHNKNKNIPD